MSWGSKVVSVYVRDKCHVMAMSVIKDCHVNVSCLCFLERLYYDLSSVFLEAIIVYHIHKKVKTHFLGSHLATENYILLFPGA